MASVSGTNNSSYSSLSSQIRGYGGLASGLDRDTLIEQMTSGTRSKIAKQGQQKTKLEWQMEAMRDITSKIYNFTSGYTSYASPNNLLSSTLFSRNQVTAVGENSKYVSVSGTAAGADNMSIAAIKQLASNARLTTGTVSSGSLKTGQLDLGPNNDLSNESDVSTIAGDAFYIKYGNKSYTVKLLDTDDYDYSTPEKAIESIQKSLDNVTIGSGTSAQKLGDIVKVQMDGSKVKFTVDESKAHGNTVMFGGGTGNILQDLGIVKAGQEFSDLDDDEKTITADGLTGTYDAKLTEKKSLAQRLSGSQICFNYNGETKWITLNKYESIDKIDKVKEDLQNKLNDAFGKNRIKVSADTTAESGKGILSFETVKKGGVEDDSSTLSITAGTGIVGNSGAFGIAAGASNRVNLSANLKDSGLATSSIFKNTDLVDEKGNYNLIINGKKVEGITKDTTVKEIMNKINATEGIGVTVSYQEMSDRFVVTATGNGTSGDIKFDNEAAGEKENIAKYLFGDRGESEVTDPSGILSGNGGTNGPQFTYEEGKDAVLSVKYPGSDDPIEITRGSNTFTLDGLNVTLKGAFGYKKDDAGNYVGDVDGKPVLEDVEPITFEATVNADKTVEAVKSMVDSFNEILELVNTHVKTKPDRDYSPLTDEQKEELSESQIEKWETKAKQGILFADMDLRMMADNLRSVINSANTTELSNIGITVSTNYSDNGKLVFDETKFRTALQKDPEAVKNAFTRAASTDENGKSTQGGLMVKMKSIMDKYGSTTGATKGILIERAGSIYAPTSVLSNSLQKQMDRIDNYIKQLQDKLETETDRYISQFTSLETLISQMNNQSSYLSSMFS